MKTSEIPRLERYLKFHLEEVVEKLGSNTDSDADTTWSFLTERLLQSREEISSALTRIRDGTYGNCVGCGNEIGLARLKVVPWAQFCDVCQEESEQRQPAQNRFFDRPRGSTAQSSKEAEGFFS
jgi:DnaK suppressor protein